jgi:ABC-2 type transport system ATP-binding protein
MAGWSRLRGVGTLSGLSRVNAIEVIGLVRRYGDFIAVDDFDLEVATGECVAMLGPNGAGKTTTVEILEGYRHRDAGSVTVLGEDPAHVNRAWRQRIGIVLQSANDLIDATVTEALEHFARFYESPRAVSEVIALVGLEEKADQRAGLLSGGQRRRLDVALGVVGSPELLFLDEPTTGFDPEARRVFWQLIERLKGEGVTILLTTHYLEEADALADRVVVISRGKKLADTTPADLGNRHEGRIVVRWREGDAVREEVTATPAAFVATLSARFGGEVPGLEVLRPTLEEAYLELVDAAS